uniref:cytochrome b n=1 Tax=Satsuma myomphala TaxID=358001 RepID=UPI003003923C
MKKIREIESLLGLPSPSNISVWWNMGSLLGFILVLQLVTGFLLSFHYTADLYCTFNSIIHIMRDVPGGWFLRSMHANGASFFFLLMYIHIGRGIYYQSYMMQPRTWMVGVTIFLVSMGTAFLGYVLPWGQMSYWGATVITNLMSAIPYFGTNLVEWVWGGFSVGQPTLNRFYSLHFLLPFVLSVLVMLHLVFLHEKGSTNPLGSLHHVAKIPFHPYFTIKDIVGVVLLSFIMLGIVFFGPNLFTDPENFIEANPMMTPVHIQPEWYFLYAYAILRSIPSKLGGVLALVFAVTYLYFFPVTMRMNVLPMAYSPISQFFFWQFVVVFGLLTWLGACPVEDPYVNIAPYLTVMYFALPILMQVSNSIWYKLIIS